MNNIAELKQQIICAIDAQAQQLKQLALGIHAHPELGGEEHYAVQTLTEYLRQQGFAAREQAAGLPTAFQAVRETGSATPKVAYLAEYDALPEIGHACGHNLIAMAGVAAAVGLAAVLDRLPGHVAVFGTPAEETNGAKVIMSAQGLFDGYDAAMIVHPGSRTSVIAQSLAIDALEFTFTGKPAHAAAAPHEGINALDAVVQLFNSLNALRQHLKPDVRMHGIISEGGTAPNIVPERAVARFYFRAENRSYLDQVVQKAKAAAEGAALATGARLEIKPFELSNDNLITNHTLADVYAGHLQRLGWEELDPPSDSKGSTDMGNVSHHAPSIHPSMRIGSSTLAGHTHEFCQAAGSEQGMENMLLAGKAMALSGLDVLLDTGLRQRIVSEFRANA